jgi:hypothetical protein
MPVTININGLTLCHKGSNGISTATIPDVCNTPSPAGPVPIPYPNIAMSSDLAKGTTTVSADGGNMCAIYGSEFSKSTGDEPGTVGGVTSGTFIKEATWITYSFDVKLEGQGACRLTDKMFMNHNNTVCAGGILQAFLKGPKGPAECALLLLRITALTFGDATTKGLIQRFVEQITGSGPTAPMDRPPGPDFPNGSNPWMRHDWEIDRQQTDLAEMLDAYEKYCKGGPPPPAEAYEYGTKPRPQPSEWTGPVPQTVPEPPVISPPSPGALVAVGAVVLVVAAIALAPETGGGSLALLFGL